MKNIIQLIVNLISWWILSFTSFFGIIWYGKLPKVSLYHWTNNGTLYKTKDMYNDINCQVKSLNDVPKEIKDRILKDYINQLYKNEGFRVNIMALDIPLFDGKKVYGRGSVIDIFNEVKTEYLK